MMYHYTSVMALVLTILMASFIGKGAWVVDLSIMNSSAINLSASFTFESQSKVFVMTVLTIFMMVYIYSFSYLSSEVYLKRFLSILALFAASMCILILSSNLFSSLIGWDGLGVTSLFLILFYYSKSALKAATLTFLMNRVGDCFFIMALTQVILLGGNLLYDACSCFSLDIALLMILTSITKSAQIPFSTWLPAAMEAPTPVSALVHSSTLVTAGIYLLYRYSVVWKNSSYKELLMILSLATCFMAALSALVESDLKKLIALSTLSQLGFIMFSLSLGLLEQGFLHMLMHAYFKALLFMCAGFVIHSFKNSQSILNMSISSSQNPLLMTIMGCSLASMSGLPYLSGFYSKDYLIDSLKESNEWIIFIFFLLIVSFLCTIMYSARIIWYLLNSSNNWHCASDEESSMMKPMVPLAMMASIGGSASAWLLTEKTMYVESSKMLILLLLVVVSVVYLSLSQVSFSAFLESKWNLSTFNPILADSLFRGTLMYKYSSDLLGVPEMCNKHLKLTLSALSTKVSYSMVHYLGSLEFILFLAVILLLM